MVQINFHYTKNVRYNFEVNGFSLKIYEALTYNSYNVGLCLNVIELRVDGIARHDLVPIIGVDQNADV